MNDHGSLVNCQPTSDSFALKSSGEKLYSSCYDHINQEASNNSSAKGSTGVKTEDVAMNSSKTYLSVQFVPKLKEEHLENNFKLRKYLEELDSFLQQLGYRIISKEPISKEPVNAKKTAYYQNESQTDVPTLNASINKSVCEKDILLPTLLEKRLKQNNTKPKPCRHESKPSSTSLPSLTRNPSHQLSEHGRYGISYRARDPLNSTDRHEIQLKINMKRKAEEKEEAVERQKDLFSKRGVFGEYSNVLIPDE